MSSINKQQDASPIDNFNQYYDYLNNDFPSWVLFDNLLFPTISTAYQAARTDNQSLRKQLSVVQSYDQFKKISLEIKNPDDWISRRYKIMESLVRDKFKRNKELGQKLAATQSRKLINTFSQGNENESYWGVINGKGYNALGLILMSVREEIQQGTDSQKWILDQGLQTNQKLFPQASLVVQKDQKSIDKWFLQKDNKYLFGSLPKNKFKLDHPSISKNHATIFYKSNNTTILVDLNSSHGTTITRNGEVIKLEPLRPIALQPGDILAFGLSSRKYKIEISYQKAIKYGEQRRILQNQEKARKRKILQLKQANSFHEEKVKEENIKIENDKNSYEEKRKKKKRQRSRSRHRNSSSSSSRDKRSRRYYK